MSASNTTKATKKAPAAAATTVVATNAPNPSSRFGHLPHLTHQELTDRKKEIQERLKELDIKNKPAPANQKSHQQQHQKKLQNDEMNYKNATTSDTTNNDKSASTTLEQSISTLFPPTSPHPILPKTDTHWDYTLKEMMWLSADFQAERKRQLSQAKKLANAVKLHHSTLHTRKLREHAEFEARVRRLGAKLGRDVFRGYWKKIERVVGYKQRLEGEERRRMDMDRHLVFLVRQTEKYGESLIDGHQSSNGVRGGEETPILTIEEALSQSNALSQRRSKKAPIDYSRMDQDENFNESTFYGEPIASSSIANEDDKGNNTTSTSIENDEDFVPDDEELLIEEESDATDMIDFLQAAREQSVGSVKEEVQKLLEEMEMGLDNVLQRLVDEGQSMVVEGNEGNLDSPKQSAPLIEVIGEETYPDVDDSGGDNEEKSGERVEEISNNDTEANGDSANQQKRRVTFATSLDEQSLEQSDDNNESENIAAEIDEIENENSKIPLSLLDEDDNEEKDEFHPSGNDEMDDETTIEAEEKMGREISYEDEIALLKSESEMSIEELRAMYARMEEADHAENDAKSVESDAASSYEETATPPLSLLEEDDHEDEDEFRPSGDGELDDETTIEAEEKLGREMSYEDEISLLQRENEMSIEELRAMYAGMEEANKDENVSDNMVNNSVDSESDGENAKTSLSLLDEDDHDEKDEFHPSGDGELDDETTIEAEEKLGRDMSYEDEIALLQRESEMSIEELRAMYANTEETKHESDDEDDRMDVDSDTAESSLALLSTNLDDNDDEDEEEFTMILDANSEVDDETTIAAEEKLGREMTYEEEISQLEKENELSVDDLIKLYGLNQSEDDLSPKRKHSSSNNIDDESDDSGKKSPKKVKTDTNEGLEALQSLAASDAKARETMLTRPFLLAGWVKLRIYQHIGLNWLVSIQSRRLNGILADEMGLGKTLQTISMLAYLASYKGIWGPHLIIVPTSCLVNWEVEFKRFCPGLKVLCYYGNAKRRKELRVGWTKSNWYHVIITSYQLAVQDAFAFKRKKWYYLILDEAHNIKNFESQRWQTLINFNTQRRLLLTGTPLQNNLMELWSLLHFLMPHVFRDRKEFSYWFSNPMDNIIEGNAKRNDDLISRLHGIIRPFILRRLKKDVETQLPGKYEHIVKCQLSRRQMFLYEEFMARSSTRKSLQGGNFMGMMNVLMQLRKVCNHPDLFEPRSVITPFTMEPLSMSTAACVINAIEPKSGLEQLSPFLLLPLWSNGQGTPSFEESSLVDDIFAGQLADLMTSKSAIIENAMECDVTEPMPNKNMSSGLFCLLSRMWVAEKRDRIANAEFISDINSWRCKTSIFPYSHRKIQAVTLEPRPLDLPLRCELTASQVASTPTELIAMRRSQEERAEEVDELVDKFVFCVPKAGTRQPVLFSSRQDTAYISSQRILSSKTSHAFETYFSAFSKASSRLTTCFPDKKLVQFDAGKLQTLATLLRERKRGGHRVLIFTQMSKMLDVLEAFLNLNGHTYLRLDGATDVERRQRLMDRFNSDPKVFCFILSTRSGGLGINLTGADTVVFYDSDWNPAMDAQAQDRAHRIGQTREVHIYRLITEHSIEENILTKAKQKRNLDFLVMNEGKFHASSTSNDAPIDDGDNDDDDEDGFTTGKLRNIFGIQADGSEESKNQENEGSMSKDQIESAMNLLEDEDDVKAMQSARKEAVEELQEFDESIQFKQDDDEAEVDDEVKSKQKKKNQKKQKMPDEKNCDNVQKGEDDKESLKDDDDEKELEKEFATWQSKVGMDATKINDSLNPLERYGLNVKETIDPYYSPYYFAEQKRLEDASNMKIELDLDEIEQIKVDEEQRAFEDGDLLATFPDPEALARQRQLYIREKARLRSETIKRKLTGQNWTTRIDEKSKKPFYLNEDTGEAMWEKPNVLSMLEAEEISRAEGWRLMPLKPLVNIMEFLVPHPERNRCAATCHRWREAASDISFVKHVWPVEMGALAMDEKKLGKNHFCTIADAMDVAVPGDTIELGDGHYWIQDGLIVNIPVKIVGDEFDPSHVVIELSGEISWNSNGGWMEGVTIRRPRIVTGLATTNDILRIQSGGRLNLFHCIFDNQGSLGNVVSMVGSNSGGRWKKASIVGGSTNKSGLLLDEKACAEFTDSAVCDNSGVGIACRGGSVISLDNCRIERNGVNTTIDDYDSNIHLDGCNITKNVDGITDKPDLIPSI